MNNLIRRALLGDRKAQEECTRQGIALPCPCCVWEMVDDVEAPGLGGYCSAWAPREEEDHETD